jgi:hypothetical protein
VPCQYLLVCHAGFAATWPLPQGMLSHTDQSGSWEAAFTPSKVLLKQVSRRLLFRTPQLSTVFREGTSRLHPAQHQETSSRCG